jgi:FkbM family methyltransferase
MDMAKDARSLPRRIASRVKWFPKQLSTHVRRARQKDVDQGALDGFLREARGVIHVGAHKGQERHLYAEHDLDVVWIEPIPDVYAVLCSNLADHPRQRALQALVTDEDDRDVTLHVSSNDGGSSSILELNLHQDIWPDITYVGELELRSVTLPTLLERQGVGLDSYDALVLDTQGSELLVLRGAQHLLPSFRYVKVEAADFEAYRGCCQLVDIERFMRRHGFRRHSRAAFATQEGVGTFFDVVYERRSAGPP